jgi:transposase-like protein
VEFIYYWSLGNIKGDQIKRQTVIGSDNTITDWNNFTRDVCAQYFLDDPQIIGGPNMTVEIDESKFGHRKHNRGRIIDGRWVLGGICRETRETFLVPCPGNRRDAATLLPIIQAWVHPGTEVLTDEWRAYAQLQANGFQHRTINHTLHYVDPNDRTLHTNTVEGMWNCVKRKFKRMNGTRKEGPLLNSYLQQFMSCMWRENFGKEDAFHNIINHIIQQYPLQ